MRLIPLLSLFTALSAFAIPEAEKASHPAGEPSFESVDTLEDRVAPPPEMPEASESPFAKKLYTPVPADTQARAGEPQFPPKLEFVSAFLTRLELGGTVQLKSFYHNFAADNDVDKSLSLDLRRLRVDLLGALGDHFGFEGQFLLEGDGGSLGIENGYLYYVYNKLFGLRGGKMKRPFSQEALQSSKGLFTVERGELYQNFLARETGYSSFDLGLVFYGGFIDEDVPVGYEIGVFNGKQSLDSVGKYSNQQYSGVDRGFLAKDAVIRLTVTPFSLLKVEAAVSTKAAEDVSDPSAFKYAVNTAYQLGLDFAYHQFRLLGEAAWGDNHQGLDARIISGSSQFFAFYGTAVWHEDYPRGRASELVLKLEGLDPDFDWEEGEGRPNDGKLLYTVGVNYFFAPTVSVLANYSMLQPITKVPQEDALTHSLDLLWRLSF